MVGSGYTGGNGNGVVGGGGIGGASFVNGGVGGLGALPAGGSGRFGGGIANPQHFSCSAENEGCKAFEKRKSMILVCNFGNVKGKENP